MLTHVQTRLLVERHGELGVPRVRNAQHEAPPVPEGGGDGDFEPLLLSRVQIGEDLFEAVREVVVLLHRFWIFPNLEV